VRTDLLVCSGDSAVLDRGTPLRCHARVCVLACLLGLGIACSAAPQASRVNSGVEEPLRGGVLVTVSGTRYGSGTSASPQPDVIHVLYVVPTNGRGRTSRSSELTDGFVMVYDFETEHGDIFEADTLVIAAGSRLQMGTASFDLAVGNLFVVYVNEGPERIRQVAERVTERLEPAALLATFQRAFPEDSLVQAVALLH